MVDLGCIAGVTFDTTGQFVSEIAVWRLRELSIKLTGAFVER